MKVKHSDSVNIGNTFYQGVVNVSYNKLVKTFGEPGEGDYYKSEVEWRLKFPDGTIATIYDYKVGPSYLGPEEGVPPEKNTIWHIGGHNTMAVIHVKIALFGKKYVIKALFSGEIDIEKLDL